MNVELLKRLGDMRDKFNELQKQFDEDGAYGIRIDGEVHVDVDSLVGKENLKLEERGDSHYPYEISTFVEGIKIFGLATTEKLSMFPQLKENRKTVLLKELAELEKAEEETTV